MAALLPTQTKMNPSKPETAEYYDQGQVAFVVEKVGYEGDWVRSLRCLTSFGTLTGWEVGTTHEVRHDQTGRYLGHFRVVGIATYAEGGTPVGIVPDKALPHWVFK